MRQHLASLAAVLAIAAPAVAAAPTVQVSGAWARPTPPGAATGALYLTLTNGGRTADSLVSASSPAAAKVEFHTMSMAGGVMTMRPVALPIPIAQGGVVRFAPGAEHIMLTGLKEPLTVGAKVRLTLRFARAGAVSIDVPVSSVAPAAHDMPGMRM